MKRLLKILIAATLLGTIIFFGVRYYLEQKEFKENESAALMDMLIGTTDEESKQEKIVYEDITDEEKINKIKEYISSVCITSLGAPYFPEFNDVKNIDEDFISYLVYCNCNSIEKEANENGIIYYTYPELNRVVVKLLGKNAHNMLPNKTTEYFSKTTDGLSMIGRCGSESLSYSYVIDKIRVANDGLYYIDMYEYVTEREVIDIDVTIEDNGKKMKLTNIDDELVLNYTLDVTPYSEFEVTSRYLDENGNEVTEETIVEDVKENLDKFKKRTLILEYDEELDLYYLQSNSIER